ncbi:MAG: hypothetical protein KF745_15000 [Phycisphaeraceae bacterium]|nr:hypothetical protein [Phycisphaeraceae bacterium]
MNTSGNSTRNTGQGNRRTRARRGTVIAFILIAAAGVAPSPRDAASAPPQAAEPMERPSQPAAIRRLLRAEYLTEDELKDLRIFHGLWEPADLDTPARMARAALTSGALDDPSLKSLDADPLDRAEAMLLRGELAESLAALEGRADPRSVRIRAEALAAMGRYDDAVEAMAPLVAAAVAGSLRTPADLVDGVRVLALRSRLRAGDGPAGGDYRAMMSILARVRDSLDRLYWPAMLVEAELLLDKDNPSEAQQALIRTLELNPSCARAWAMLGDMAVWSFDLAAAERIAARLDITTQAAGTAAGDEQDADSARGASPLASMLRARASLRINDPESAAELLDEALARYPAMRGAVALRAAVAARAYDDEALAKWTAAYDALSPGSALAVYEIGRTLAEARQYALAADYLGTAHERLPSWPAPLIELGLLEIQAGRDARAERALTEATRLDPFNVRAGNSLKLVTELRSYDTIESEHFIIRYKPGIDGVMAREMVGPLEENYRIVTGAGPGGIDYAPTTSVTEDGLPRTVIDLMPDHRWFGVRIAGMPAIHTIAASTGPVIAMETPREGANHLGTYDWARVVRHEFTHTVSLARTNNRIPHWFTEAAAVYLELAPRENQTCRLLADALRSDALFDFTAINLAFIRPEKPTDRSLAYAQAHWMYQFMIERFGREAPLELMDQYAKGVREEAAFQAVLGVSRDAFFDAFTQWAQGQVQAWGLAPKAGQPTIRDLLRREAAAKTEPADEDAADPLDRKPAAKADQPVDDDSLPDITREMVGRWLDEYPDLADALEIAIDMDLQGTAGVPTAVLVPLLERYAAARPVDPLPHRLLAKYYLAGNGDGPDAAIPHLEYLDAREQKSPAYAAELARRYAATGNWDAAFAKAERATQIAPYDPQERELAASVAIKKSDFAAAERHLTALTQLEPDRPIHKQRLEALKALRDQHDDQ